MCTLILLRDQIPGYPLFLLMNRDELYGRPSEEPTLTREPTSIVAPRDVQAGGTWIGVNEVGVVAAISNREEGTYDSARRSRGLLCLEALRHTSALEVKDFVEAEVAEEAYNPFNLLYGDRGHAFVTHYAGEPRTVELGAGLHVLTNMDVDDATQPRVHLVQQALRDLGPEDLTAAIQAVQEVAADHTVFEGESVCRHGDRAGTVSSSLLAISENFPRDSLFLYSADRPHHSQFEDYSALLEGFMR
ncbi:MAG: NRDE family protein [Thermoplasmata archaeon]